MPIIKEYWPYPDSQSIITYIEERIETIGSDLWLTQSRTTRDYMNLARIEELQAVLNKIKEQEKEEISQARGESFFNDRN